MTDLPLNTEGPAPFRYDGLTKELVYALKFEGKREAARVMAQLLLPHLPARLDAVTFVPTATTRVRERGFDHAHLLAKEVARLRRVPCLRLLARTTQARQLGATKQDRLLQAAIAYRPWPGFDLAARRVLLLDDVTSSGASLQSCARLLEVCGAAVVPLAFAQQPLVVH